MIGSSPFSFLAVSNNDFACADSVSVKCLMATSSCEATNGTPIGELTNENKLVIDGKGSTSQWFKGFITQKDGLPARMFATEKLAARRPILQKGVTVSRFRSK